MASRSTSPASPVKLSDGDGLQHISEPSSPEENGFASRESLEQEGLILDGSSDSHHVSTVGSPSGISVKDEDRSTSSHSPSKQKNCVYRRPRNPAVLVLWIEEHSQNPYPSKAEKHYLAHCAGMTQRQLNDWFANARRNIKKVGYQTWKVKHSAYSAYFSGINPFHSEGMTNGVPFALTTPDSRCPQNCSNDSLKASSINYAQNNPCSHHGPMGPLPTAMPPAKLTHNNRSIQYLVQQQQQQQQQQQPTILNAAHHQQPMMNTLRQVASATAGINSAAYYSSTCIGPMQVPVTGINFMSARPSNGNFFSSSGRQGALPSQFHSSPIGITAPWTNSSASAARNAIFQQERRIIPVNSDQGSSPIDVLSPESMSSQEPPVPKNTEATHITVSQSLDKPMSSLAASTSSPEQGWGSTSPHSTNRPAAHHAFENSQVSSIGGVQGSQQGQEVNNNQWCATNSWNNAYIIQTGTLIPTSREELQ